MKNMFNVLLAGVIGLGILAAVPVHATFQAPKVEICHNGETIEVSAIAAIYHLQHHEGDYRGACKEEPVDVCSNLEGNQEVTPEGYENNDGVCSVPEEPEPTCEELQNCPVETPPVVVEEPKKDSKDHDGCKEPSKAQGFRYEFVGTGNLLKWEKKGSWDKVDIAVYGPDKTTLLYYVRTADDGKHLIDRQDTWHRIRGINKCELGAWSKLIN